MKRLSENAVFAIRREHAQGKGVMDLAARFEVSERTVNDIVVGRTWKKVPMDRALFEAFVTFIIDERSIVGAIKSTIHAHGDIDLQSSPSAAKRIRGALKARANQFRKNWEGKRGAR